MKRHLFTLIASCLLLLANACQNNFLEVNPQTFTSTNTFFKNEQELRQIVNGSYATLRDLTRSIAWVMMEMRSDNTSFQFNSGDRGNEQREFIDAFLITATAEPVEEFWRTSYVGIARTNDVLDNIDRVPGLAAEAKARYTGEVKFLRALHYFNLVRLYGGVPIRLTSAKSPEDATQGTRATPDQVYEAVVADLTDAVSKLPDRHPSSETGRVTKGAAQTLLAKVYLTRCDYANAASTLRQVMALGYSLLPDYAAIYNPANKNHAESIFDIQFLAAVPDLANNFLFQFAPYTSGGAVTGIPGALGVSSGWNIPTTSLINAYEPGDKRKAVSVADGYTDATTNQFVAIPYVRKFSYPLLSNYRGNENFPLLRYADVLLMLAECLNEQGYQAGAKLSGCSTKCAPVRDYPTTPPPGWRTSRRSGRRLKRNVRLNLRSRTTAGSTWCAPAGPCR